MKNLFTSYSLGPITLSNRIVMAPMTRSRAVEGNVPNPLAREYYRQRAGAGLIVTEATQVSADAQGYVRTPGIHTAAQVEEWKRIVEGVHLAGGRIYVQLWHTGRVSHPDFHGGRLPVAPSAIAIPGETYTPQGKKPFVAPRALEAGEIRRIVDDFRSAAKNALDAGFDGVEIHGANGYLLDQFLRDGSNHRQDAYGGSIANRARFPLEVTDAVVDVFGGNRVGYRISPHGDFNAMSDSNPRETFTYLVRELNRRGIVYLHLIEGVAGPRQPQGEALVGDLRKAFSGTLIINGGYDKKTGNAVIERGDADLVAFGVPFIANPDLVRRLKLDAPLAAPDPATFYAGDERGYADYPTLPD